MSDSFLNEAMSYKDVSSLKKNRQFIIIVVFSVLSANDLYLVLGSSCNSTTITDAVF